MAGGGGQKVARRKIVTAIDHHIVTVQQAFDIGMNSWLKMTPIGFSDSTINIQQVIPIFNIESQNIHISIKKGP